MTGRQFPTMRDREYIKEFVEYDNKMRRASGYGFGGFFIFVGMCMMFSGILGIGETARSGGATRIITLVIGMLLFVFGMYLFVCYRKYKRAISGLKFYVYEGIVKSFEISPYHGRNYVKMDDGNSYDILAKYLKYRNVPSASFRVAILSNKDYKYSFAFPSDSLEGMADGR